MSFDSTRYQGLWYEAGKYPFFFEQDCENATAEYSLDRRSSHPSPMDTLEGDSLRVVNTCFINNSPVRQDIGLARPSGKSGTFLLTFTEEVDSQTGQSKQIMSPESEYTVLSTDYDNWSFVSSNLGNYWILSRHNTFSQDDYEFFYNETVNLGFDPDKVKMNFTSLS